MAVIAQDALIQPDQDHAVATVDDHWLVMAKIGTGTARAHYRRNTQAARQDRGVRQRSAVFGDKGQHPLMLHENGVSRGQIVGNDDAALKTTGSQFGVIGIVQIGRILGDQDALHPAHHMLDIVLAGAQIGIVHLLEDLHQRIPLDLQRPLGVAAPRTNQFNRRLGEGGILQHQQVGVDKRRHIPRGRRRNAHADIAQLPAGDIQTAQKPLDFVLDNGFGNGVLGDFELITLQQIRPADGVAPGNPDPLQRKRHAASLSFVLVKTALDQFFEMRQRLFGLRAGSLQFQVRTAGGRQHHHPHDALAVDFATAARQTDLGIKAGSQGHKLGSGAGVQPEPVDDDDVPFQHPGDPVMPRCPNGGWA